MCAGKTDDIDDGQTTHTQNLLDSLTASSVEDQVYHKCQAHIFYWFVLYFSMFMSLAGYQVHIVDCYTNDKILQEDILAKERKKTVAEKKRGQYDTVRMLKSELNLMRVNLINQSMGQSI
jgi:hypothetical protein